MWKLAFRNVLRHKARTLMALMAIVVGVIALVLSGGFVYDIFKQLGEVLIHSQSGHIQVSRKGYFEHGARDPAKYLISNPEPLSRRIAAIPGVDEVMGRLYFSGLISNGRSDLPMVGAGVEPMHEARLGSGLTMTAGHRLKDKYGIVIGQGLSHALKLNPGDWATLMINTPDGAMNSMEFKVVGVFQTFSRDFDARAVRISLPAAQQLMVTKGINTLVIALKRTRDTEMVAAALDKKFINAGLEVKTWLELNDFYTKTVQMYDAQFGVLRIIILVMVLLSVANSVNMSLFERVGEFGTMMALGNRELGIFSLIIAENTIIGAFGALAGVALGVLLALIISAVGIPMPPPPGSDLSYIAHIQIVASVVTGAFAIGLVATVGAALLPALRVSRIPVAQALRENV